MSQQKHLIDKYIHVASRLSPSGSSMGEEAFFVGPTTWRSQVVMGASYNAHAALRAYSASHM